jgi:imidazolonepropionase-like amidohydrolase
MTPNSDPKRASLTLEELSAGFGVANDLGKISASHAQSTQGIKNSIKAGVRTVEHGFWLDDEACEMMVKKNVYFSVTLTAGYRFIEFGEDAGIPKYMMEKMTASYNDLKASVRLAKKHGVKIIIGTDAGTPYNYPGDAWLEIKLLNDLGLSAEELIKAATSLGAEAMKIDHLTGSLKAGKLAELLVVAQDPTKDLKTLENPIQVFAQNKWFDSNKRHELYAKKRNASPEAAIAMAGKVIAQGCACC